MIEETNRNTITFVMYLILVLLMIVFVGAVTALMSVPIGMTHAAVDANFASKAVLAGGLTKSASVVAVPELAGINPFVIEFDHYSEGIEVAGQTRKYGYKVKMDTIGLAENQSTMSFPYALPIDNFFPTTPPINSGETVVIYYHNVRWTEMYDAAAVRPFPEDVIGPFGKTITF